MPTRGYRCEGCDKEFEVQQKISEEKLTKCEDCGGELTALVGPVTFKLKGGGWHNTDYGKRGPR